MRPAAQSARQGAEERQMRRQQVKQWRLRAIDNQESRITRPSHDGDNGNGLEVRLRMQPTAATKMHGHQTAKQRSTTANKQRNKLRPPSPNGEIKPVDHHLTVITVSRSESGCRCAQHKVSNNTVNKRRNKAEVRLLTVENRDSGDMLGRSITRVSLDFGSNAFGPPLKPRAK